MTHPSTKALALACLFATACAPVPSAGTKFLTVTLALPSVHEGVFLNEPLTFFFSGELDRAAVTSESFTIRSPDGAAARGTLSLNGNSLTFTPKAVLASDLSDGGYRPDTQYTVQIHGFPWVDGLRGTNGEPLSETYEYTFTTVSAAEPFETLLFADPEPEKTRLMGLFPPAGVEHLIGSDDAIYLDSDKPIDPTSLHAADFVLRPNERGREPVQLRARLIENEAEARSRPKPRHVQSIAMEANWESQPRAALIELTPVKKLQPLSSWRLSLARDETGVDATGPRDFSGHTLWNPGLQIWIHVGYRTRDAGKGVLYEDFVSTELGRQTAVPEADGLAHWSTNGRVEVRFPAAAGLGTDGHVELAGSVASDDVHAIALEVKAGQRATLSAAEGLVIVRAQGMLRIAGQLTREVVRGGKDLEPPIGLYTNDPALLHSVTLTRWLERMREAKRNLTVFVAGGDLVIDADADLRVNTPILLVAGGHVRVNGHVRATYVSESGISDSVFVLGDGGGDDIQPRRENATLLEMDLPCEGNPLREVLHYAVLSGPLPPRGKVALWTSAEAGGSALEKPGETLGSKPTKNQNRWSVRYVHEVTGKELSIEGLGPADRPQTLEPVGPIQMLIELWVAPGLTFDPPFVDFVRLTWEPGGPR